MKKRYEFVFTKRITMTVDSGSEDAAFRAAERFLDSDQMMEQFEFALADYYLHAVYPVPKEQSK